MLYLSLITWTCLLQVKEMAKMLLDAGEEIPCNLMAKLLKFQLLQVKTSDQQRREAEQASRNLQSVWMFTFGYYFNFLIFYFVNFS